jgi:hypothetical protein
MVRAVAAAANAAIVCRFLLPLVEDVVDELDEDLFVFMFVDEVPDEVDVDDDGDIHEVDDCRLPFFKQNDY